MKEISISGNKRFLQEGEYGHHVVWQFWDESREMINKPNPNWEEALYRPGAGPIGF